MPEDLTKGDLQKMLSFDDQISWGYVNYKAYHAGIIIFDGKASKLGENLWEISIDGDTEKKVSFKVIFSGKNAETDEENRVVALLVNSMIKNPETTQSQITTDWRTNH